MTEDELRAIERRDAVVRQLKLRVGSEDIQTVVDALNDRRVLLAEVRRLQSDLRGEREDNELLRAAKFGPRYSTEAVDALLDALDVLPRYSPDEHSYPRLEVADLSDAHFAADAVRASREPKP